MYSTFTPLGDGIVVRVHEDEVQTDSGIFIPESVRDKPQRGEVISVGAGGRNSRGDRIDIDLQVGDTVLFTRYGGTEIKVGIEEFLVLREADILGTLS